MIRAARHMLTAATALLLSACGGFEGDTYGNVYDAVLASLGGGEEAAPQPDHAQVFALPYATIALQVEALQGPDAPALLAATTAAGGRVWYLDGARRGVGLEGGRIAGTRGMTRDVLGAPVEAGADPLRARTRPGDWPAGTLIVQRRRDGLGREASRAFHCRIENAGPETVTLYQVTRELVRMREHCANARGGFVNDHWIDAETGAMWRTRQWLGPDTGWLSIAVIKPFGGS